MSNLKGASAALFAWFCIEPMKLKSLASIDNRCINLLLSANMQGDIYRAREAFFIPLLRSGVIEFYGQNKYGLSPSCILNSGENMLVINGPNSVIRALGDEGSFIAPGVYRIIKRHKKMYDFSSTHIPRYTFDFSAIWQKLAKPAKIVSNWATVQLDVDSNFEFFDGSWKKSKQLNLPGAYRRSGMPYAERYCLLDSGEWKLIPDRAENLDAFNFAVLYGKIHNQKSLSISYFRAENKLLISESRFPMIVERLLFLNTQLVSLTADTRNREYYADKNTAQIINSWTNNLINYAE